MDSKDRRLSPCWVGCDGVIPDRYLCPPFFFRIVTFEATNKAMVRRKAATSSVAAVTVYRDGPGSLDSDDDDTSHHLPPKKKTRLGKEPPVAPVLPRTRRVALTEKATNPSSSDNSFFRPIEHHELLHEKPRKVKKKTPDSETIATNSGMYPVS